MVIALRIYFLIIDDLFKIKKINLRGCRNTLILLLEYLTKQSVNIDIDNTSTNLDIEYINGVM